METVISVKDVKKSYGVQQRKKNHRGPKGLPSIYLRRLYQDCLGKLVQKSTLLNLLSNRQTNFWRNFYQSKDVTTLKRG